MERLPLHCLFMGRSGVGKDTIAATFPKDMLVIMADGFGQDMPYIRGAKSVSELKQMPFGNATIPYREVEHEDGKVRVEYFSSDDPTAPVAIELLEARMAALKYEVEAYKTIVFSSLSAIALEARFNAQYVTNPTAKGQAQLKWYGAASAFCERLFKWQAALPCNTIFTAHIQHEQDSDGNMIYTIVLPGKLRFSPGNYFNEVYRLYAEKTVDGMVRKIQTELDDKFEAKSQIDAPNGMILVKGDKNIYENLWENWK